MLRYLFRYLLLQSKILQVGLFLMEGVYDVATNIESHRKLKCHLIEILAICPCFLKLLFVGRDKVLDFI